MPLKTYEEATKDAYNEADADCLVSGNLGTAIFEDADKEKVAWVDPDADEFTSDKIFVSFQEIEGSNNMVWKKTNKGWRHFPIKSTGRKATVFEVSDSAKKYRCGNCDAMADIAYRHLVENGIFPVELIGVSNSHSIVVVNRTDSSEEALQDFNLYGDDAWVCDPWAKIVCKAKDYPLEFFNKMDEWQKKGRRIKINANNKLGYQWIIPLDWCVLPLGEKKVNASLTYAQAALMNMDEK